MPIDKINFKTRSGIGKSQEARHMILIVPGS